MKIRGTKMQSPKQWERKDNFEESYFQEYSGATYAKAYPDNELTFIRNKIEERAYIIEQNLAEIKEKKEDRRQIFPIGYRMWGRLPAPVFL